MARTYESKLDLIQKETGLILVEQPHGLTAYDDGERKAKSVVVEGEKVHDLLMLDALTLNMLRTMVDNLSEKHRATFLSWSWASMGEMGWECVGACSKKESAKAVAG